MSRTSNSIIVTAVGIVAAALATLGLGSADAKSLSAPAQVQLDMATLHAAALTKARTTRDSADAPYLFVTVFGPGKANMSMQMPATSQHWAIRQDEAKGAAPLTSITVEPGDSVRVLFTLLEADQVSATEETTVARSLTKLPNAMMNSATAIAPQLMPLTTLGAQWIGSAMMLLTNEGGKTYWRALDCVSTCKVSNSPVKSTNESELTTNAKNALAGVLELNGNAATYHLQVTAKRSM
ncbi:MAG: hypothetical protein ABI852_02805 [Gemmatimonadaceae bacterium]